MTNCTVGFEVTRETWAHSVMSVRDREVCAGARACCDECKVPQPRPRGVVGWGVGCLVVGQGFMGEWGGFCGSV